MQIEPNKILIIGARSKVAEALIRHFLSLTDWKLILLSSGFTSTVQVDRITCYPYDYNQSQHLTKIIQNTLPTFTINCAAVTDVDSCEIDRKKTWNINVNLVETIARICKITGSHFIHFSTDYVFDGAKGPYFETDIPNPISYYGKSKLASENVCLTSDVISTIIRTTVVYGSSSYSHSDFVDWVIKQLKKNIPFRVVTDQISNPTLTDDIAFTLIRIIDLHKKGIFNIAGFNWLSRFEFAQLIAQIFELDESLIQPILTSELSQKAKRPLKGGLLTLKAETELGVKFSTAEEGLRILKDQQINKLYQNLM
ncbi:MAG: SDR family oxidoreductase [Ignavibacteria bacterium]|nr:SDR family oxidoreductase [Ignavibacteria bacterium]